MKDSGKMVPELPSERYLLSGYGMIDLAQILLGTAVLSPLTDSGVLFFEKDKLGWYHEVTQHAASRPRWD